MIFEHSLRKNPYTNIIIYMTEIIKIITSKPDWSTKINDAKIVNKWCTELKSQGLNETVFQLIIEMLKQSNKQYDYDDDDSYNWIVELGVKPNEFSIVDKCKCECKVCAGTKFGFGSGSETESETISASECECAKCANSIIKEKKKKFLRTFISNGSSLVDLRTNTLLQKQLAKLEKSIPVDYHPGTNNQVINLVHPSMYCYVKYVTETKFKQPDNILFQWLPADIHIDRTTTRIKVTFDSYINNLSQKDNPELYDTIGNIFGMFVPKFDKVLQALFDNHRIKKFVPLSKCQVIVKLANTVLTPESTKFPAGTWHLEGLADEKIIATGIYYYEQTNITPNYLQFRSTITTGTDVDYTQDNTKYVETHYGYTIDSHRDVPCFVNLGRVETKCGTCLVFPNFMQHRVSEFELCDRTKPGTRKILVFFLIDPSERIASTVDVAEQQKLISVSDAELYRSLLMFQRKYEMTNQNNFFERHWSLCEH